MSTQSIAQTITEGARVRIVYRDAQNEVTERTICVDRVHRCTSKGRCLVVAWCERRQEYRTFAMANILWAAREDDTPLVTFASDRPPGTPVSGPADNLRTLLSVSGMDAWHQDRAWNQDRAMQAATA